MRGFWAIASLCYGFMLPVFGGDASIFDSDPAHLWNRMWQMFYAVPVPAGVTVGPEELDLPVAADLGQLLHGSKHRETVALLDQFLGNRQAELVRDPLRRAVLQHDLWAVFDWVANPAGDHQPERRVLQERLTRIIQRLALSIEEIRALPDNYQSSLTSHAFVETYDPSRRGAAFLPPDLLKADGPWVLLVDGRTRPTA